MASNGAYPGNSDYSYLPVGWTVQQLLNTATQNLGYDVVAPHVPGVELKPMVIPREIPAPTVEEFAAAVTKGYQAAAENAEEPAKPARRRAPKAKAEADA